MYDMLLVNKISGQVDALTKICALVDCRRIASSYFDSYCVYIRRILEDGFVFSWRRMKNKSVSYYCMPKVDYEDNIQFNIKFNEVV